MQPGALHRRPAPMMPTRAVRGLVALALAGGLAAVPVASVFACSCAQIELADAVRDADVAFVGRLVEAGPAPVGDEPMTANRISYTFEVERSRDATVTGRVRVMAWQDNGANCGVTFGDGGRWLVVAYASEGVLETSGCMPNAPADPDVAPAEFQTLVNELLPIVADESPTEAAPFELPVPLILGLAVAAVVIGGSAWAFVVEPRRRVS